MYLISIPSQKHAMLSYYLKNFLWKFEVIVKFLCVDLDLERGANFLHPKFNFVSILQTTKEGDFIWTGILLRVEEIQIFW